MKDTFVPTAHRLGNVQTYYFATKLQEIARLREQGHKILNLGIGSPDLPPPPQVVERLSAEVQRSEGHGYQSYRGLPELRAAFAHWYQRWFGVSLDPASELLPLMGSKEGIMHISMTFLQEGDEVLVPNPGYPTYRAVANLTGARIREYYLSASRNWMPDLDRLAAQGLNRVKIMWINYPHMPSGTAADVGFFRELVAFAKKYRILLVNDNPYAFILNEQKNSLLATEGAMDVAMELNSLSKAHNMAGWRIGLLSGAAQHLEAVMRFKTNMDSGMFRPAQLAAIEALQQPEAWYQELNEVYRSRRERVYRLLDTLQCTYATDQVGMFVWAQIPEHYEDGYELSDEILDGARVFLTPGGIFGSQGKRHVRISLCSPGAVFEEAIARIEQLKGRSPSFAADAKH